MSDLFENPPKEIKAIQEKSGFELSYKDCENFLNEVEELGYTFEYGLDAQPYNLKKL